jgi:serine/threonine-protein kinase
MPFSVSIEEAEAEFPEYEFVTALTPSEQKAAFHVREATGRDLCLKIVSPRYDIDRLNRELHALQQIAHPNVVRLEEYTYSSKPTGLRHYMVEEFIPGTDLADRLLGGISWVRSEAADLFAQLCDGLAALEAADVVHRDLKPQNIRVRPDATPVIIDFGLARHLTLPDLTLTRDGAQIGTPAYFAPEQFEGTKRDIDHRTDLFAVGVMLYEALVERHPFYGAGTSWAELKHAVCEGATHLTYSGFQQLPPRWQMIVSRLLSKERSQRPNSASQVAGILRRIRDE